MTMKISNLKFTSEMRENVWRGHSVEKPREDACRMIGNEQHAQNYIEEFGDVEIVNTGRGNHWEVPAFKVGRDEYGKLKQAYCDQHGSNQGLTLKNRARLAPPTRGVKLSCFILRKQPVWTGQTKESLVQ